MPLLHTAQAGGAAMPVARLAEHARVASQAVRSTASEGTSLAGGGYGQLRARQDDLNELAQAIRREGARVEMHKLFPPYPPEQEDRMAYLDQISGLRRQIEALMFPAAQAGESGQKQATQANDLASDISRNSQKMLAALNSKQAISGNRPLLEAVAQMDPVQ
ncbi:MAG TPA: hypothetical protein PKH69_11720 [Thiobacillaceae bacterium]|nr:hypothetical protein [Thiobacillaceae bacterium]HNU65140.1 hypothetical protein [Thiobacillaceae bacterium]